MAYYPLVSSWADIKKKDTLDFTECLGVQSCGLTATLLNLHYLFKADSDTKKQQSEEKGKQLPIFLDNQRVENKLNQNRKIKSNFDVANKNSIQRIVRHLSERFYLRSGAYGLNSFKKARRAHFEPSGAVWTGGFDV